jgi:hypothetical protein
MLFMLLAGSNAKYGCIWCNNVAFYSEGFMRMVGYAAPYLHEDLREEVYCDDARLRKTSSNVRDALKDYEAAKSLGRKDILELLKRDAVVGYSLIFKELDYVDPLNVFCVPVFHALTMGISKSAYVGLFPKYKKSKDPSKLPKGLFIPHEVRHLMKKWGEELRRTDDFDRGYRTIHLSINNYKMVELLRHSDCWSKHVEGPQFEEALRQHLPASRQDDVPKIIGMLQNMHEVVSQCLRPQEPRNEEYLTNMQCKLMELGKMIQTLKGDGGCTPNLHMLVCIQC